MPKVRRSLAKERKTPEVWRQTPLPERHGLLSHAIGYLFAELGVSVSLWMSEDWWQPIHVGPSVVSLEGELGAAPQRATYNDRMLARVKRERRAIRGEHAGFCDLFVPVERGGELWGILAIGPFLVAPLTSTQISRSWRRLSGSERRQSDAGFLSYLSLALETVTLEGTRYVTFERLAQCLALSLTGVSDPHELAREVSELRLELVPLRYAERMWQLAQRLLDDRLFRRPAPIDHGDMAVLGVRRMPKDVMVGYLTPKPGDPVADAIARARFQRACADWARSHGRILCGRVGRQGIVLIVDTPHSGQRSQRWLHDVIAQASDLARRHGLGFHAGIGVSAGTAPLLLLYRSALRAAEEALTGNQSVVLGAATAESSIEQLRELRGGLARSAGETPDMVSVRFNRYVDAVVARSGGRLEMLRAELEVGLERLIEPLLATDLLDVKSAQQWLAGVGRSAETAQTAVELTGAYRQVVAQIEAALVDPTKGRQDRGLNRALEFMRDHVEEPLKQKEVARIAGFASDYFCRLFKREVGTSFGRYRLRLRVEKAQLLLAETALSVEQIQRLAGFHSRAYFHTAFKRQVGTTPAAFRTSEV